MRSPIPALSLLLALMLAACARPPDEQRLRDTLGAMEQAIEAGDAGTFMDHVSEDFSGLGGGMDQRQLRLMVLAQTMRHENISVLPGPYTIQMHQNQRATVKVSALVTGGRLLPETGRQVQITSHWRIEDGEWICFGAEWE